MQIRYSRCTKNLSKNIFFLSILLMSYSLWGYSEKVYSGIKDIQISKNTSLEIYSYFEENCDRDLDLCLPLNKLFLNNDGYIYDFSKIIKYWNKETLVYFVKLSKNSCSIDLDKDGNPEIAIYPMVAGNNPVTDAYIYSVIENKLVFYGIGRFHFEWGPHVKNIEKGKWVEPNP